MKADSSYILGVLLTHILELIKYVEYIEYINTFKRTSTPRFIQKKESLEHILFEINTYNKVRYGSTCGMDYNRVLTFFAVT